MKSSAQWSPKKLKKVEPGAGLLQEGLAVLAGFEGEKFAENKLSAQADADTADPDPNAPLA